MQGSHTCSSSEMLLNPGFPATVSGVKGSILLYGPSFQGHFLFASFGLKAPVFANPEAGFACSQKLLCTYSSIASGSFSISLVSLFCTHVSCSLSVASPKNCLFIFYCLFGYCFCMCCLAAMSLCHFSSCVNLSGWQWEAVSVLFWDVSV